MLDNWKTILGNVFMMQGTLVQSVIGDGAVWSLSIEWWCCMLAILLIRWHTSVTIALAAVSFVSMVIYVNAHGFLLGDPNMPLRLDFALLSWGWMASFLFHRKPTKINFATMLLLPLMMSEAHPFVPLASIAWSRLPH